MTEENSDGLPLRWKKLQIITGLIGTILVPAVVAYLGENINQSLKNNELGLSYVELAVGILKEEPKPETENLRKWAIAVVNNYSAVDLPEEAKQELQQERLGAGAIDLATKFEGLQLQPYLQPYIDAAGNWAIGYSHILTSDEIRTRKISIDGEQVDYRNGITEQQARKLLEQDIQPYRQTVDNLVTVELTKNQLDALALLVSSIGIDRFQNSDLLRLLNQGKYDQVPNEMRKFNTAGGQVLAGLTRRREAEIELWNRQD